MSHGKRVLANLITVLRELESELTDIIINVNKRTEENIGVKDASFTNMKTILDTLVRKTVAEKKSEEDIAGVGQEKVDIRMYQFEILGSTDDYLKKTNQFQVTAPNLDSFKSQLLIFQDLLGDILYSICQITNYNIKSPSGILVKDLLSLETLYLRIWDLMVLISGELGNLLISKQFEERQEQLQHVFLTLKTCVNEMMKVKLAVEHFLKTCLIEIQLLAHDEIMKVGKYKKDDSSKTSKHKLRDAKSSNPNFSSIKSPMAECDNNKFDGNISCVREDFPQKSLFKQPICCPPEFLIFRPPTILIQSTLETAQQSTEPKIYSVTSIKEDDKSSLNGDKLKRKKNQEDKENVINCLQTEESKSSTSSGFLKILPSRPTFNGSKSESLEESQNSLPSSFNISKMVVKEETVKFDATPLKIEYSDLACSDTFWKTDISDAKHSLKISEKTHPEYNSVSFTNFRNPFYLESFEDQIDIENRQAVADLNGSECYAPTKNRRNFFYKNESVIELFRHPAEVKRKHYGAQNCKQTTFNMWPVAAEYIRVSRKKKSQDVSYASSSSDSSIPLATGFQNSFLTVTLDKSFQNYHHNNPPALCEDNSSYSMLNQSYIVYENDWPFDANKKISPRPMPHNNRYKNWCDRSNFQIKSVTVNEDFKNQTSPLSSCFDDYSERFGEELISIYTSKIGPGNRMNRRVIQKIVNKFGTVPMHNNLHTLTSNRGPFRLFDLNGYPLTDSAGNVLKDPYGKVLVVLDPTGLPKGDVQVFDAAGNAPKDLKFDPTQKPKSTSVILKLTDNFKRPLHLFDKYGRPLTDSNGKLMVNIHGRPLLRFDNFGRPTTDYRGGPLYTENGLRWSYKQDDERGSGENSKSIDSTTQSKTVSTEAHGEQTNTSEKTVPKTIPTLQTQNLQENNAKSTDATSNGFCDRWSLVEKLLENIHTRRQIDPKTSKNNMTINKVALMQNPIEKEYLKSIIYHNSTSPINSSYLNNVSLKATTSNQGKNGSNHFLDSENILGDWNMNEKRYLTQNSFLDNDHHFLNSPINPNKRVSYFNINKDRKSLSLYNNFFMKYPHLKGLNSNLELKNYRNGNIDYPNYFFYEKDFSIDPNVLNHKIGFSKNSSYLTDSGCFRKMNAKNSYLTFKNHDYLNNLCNQILDYKISNDGSKTSRKKDCKRCQRWRESQSTTDSSEINSTDLAVTDLITVEPKSGETSQETKYESKNRRFCNESKYYKQGSSSSYNKQTLSKITEAQSFNRGKTRSSDSVRDGKSQQASDKNTLSLNIVNQGDQHYKITIADKAKTNHRSDNIDDTTNTKESTSKIEKITNKFLNMSKHTNLKQHEDFKKPLDDSPFRFPTKEKIDTTLAVNSQSEKNTLWRVKCSPGYEIEQNNHSCQNKVRNTSPRTHSEGKYDNLANIHHKNFSYVDSGNGNSGKKSPRKRECTLVSFLGNPVKYVLKKFDSKKAEKIQTVNKTKNKHNKREKYSSKSKVKTIYVSKSGNRYFSRSNDEKQTRNKIATKGDKHQHLLAFKSRSCTDINTREISMSYSGKEKSETDNNLDNLPTFSNKMNKCSSEVVLNNDFKVRRAIHYQSNFDSERESRKLRENKRHRIYISESSSGKYSGEYRTLDRSTHHRKPTGRNQQPSSFVSKYDKR